MKKLLSILLISFFTLSLIGCQSRAEEQKKTEGQPKAERTMILSTTTSTQDSGLLDYLLPKFKEETGIEIKVVPKGTGAALELGRNGDADALLVHAKVQEEQFVKDGFGVERFDVMYNDFIIVGPKDDPAKIKEKAGSDPVSALKVIFDAKAVWISRGDESGTHTKEKSLLNEAGITPEGKSYISAGKGMGEVLMMADEKRAYTLTDRATYLSMKDKLDLVIVTEKNNKLYNQYGVIMVNPEKHDIKKAEAQEFINWILSDKIQKMIGEFGKDKYGQSLFIPNAKK